MRKDNFNNKIYSFFYLTLKTLNIILIVWMLVLAHGIVVAGAEDVHERINGSVDFHERK